ALFWPALEASLMDGEPPKRVQDFVAYFNLNWSLAAATAFLIATPLMDAFGLKVLFVLPLLCYLTNLLLLYRLRDPSPPFVEEAVETRPVAPQDKQTERTVGARLAAPSKGSKGLALDTASRVPTVFARQEESVGEEARRLNER